MIEAEELIGSVVLGSSFGEGFLAQFITGTCPGLVGGLVAINTLVTVQGIDQSVAAVST